MAQTRLRWWIKKEGRTQADVAIELGVTQHSVSRYCCGLSRPNQPASAKMKRMTEGAVDVGNFSDLVDDSGEPIPFEPLGAAP